MHSDFVKSFVRIHLLYHANQEAITPEGILSEINSHGYQVTPQEVQQDLNFLANEGYLTAKGSPFSITTGGKGELRSIQHHLEILYQEVVQNKKAVSPM